MFTLIFDLSVCVHVWPVACAVLVSVDSVAAIDYALTKPPNFTDWYIETDHKVTTTIQVSKMSVHSAILIHTIDPTRELIIL